MVVYQLRYLNRRKDCNRKNVGEDLKQLRPIHADIALSESGIPDSFRTGGYQEDWNAEASRLHALRETGRNVTSGFSGRLHTAATDASDNQGVARERAEAWYDIKQPFGWTGFRNRVQPIEAPR